MSEAEENAAAIWNGMRQRGEPPPPTVRACMAIVSDQMPRESYGVTMAVSDALFNISRMQ